MPRVATKLTPNNSGGWFARKRIPEDVRGAYGNLYGVTWEERLTLGPMTPANAKARLRDWLNEVEGRIANIRAERNGEGQSLTPVQARALSGEWYRWYVERHQARPQSAQHLEFFRDQINGALTDAVDPYRDPRDPERQEIDDVLRIEPEAQAEIRPMLADWCETAQFLAARRIALDNASRDLFLDALYDDFGVALKLLIRRAHGDYTPDTWPLRFPQLHLVEQRRAAVEQSPWKLFEAWVRAREPAEATVARWRGVFLDLDEKFSGADEPLNEDTAQAWAREKVTPERAAVTVRDIWVNAARTVYEWAKGQRLVGSNPFAAVVVTVPRKIRTRDNKAFTADEAQTILRAAMNITDTKRMSNAAKRWVPWLCAYSGARVGEVTQLRGIDIAQRGAFYTMYITPEAGSVKTRKPHTVPLHEHIVEQGFLEYVQRRGKGPLFYQPVGKSDDEAADLMKPKRPRSVKVRERLAEWVRKLGVTDPEVKPNHAWRETFKQIADRSGIPERVHDAITDHAPTSVGRSYGRATPEDMAEALKKFPRYEV